MHGPADWSQLVRPQVISITEGSRFGGPHVSETGQASFQIHANSGTLRRSFTRSAWFRQMEWN